MWQLVGDVILCVYIHVFVVQSHVGVFLMCFACSMCLGRIYIMVVPTIHLYWDSKVNLNTETHLNSCKLIYKVLPMA